MFRIARRFAPCAIVAAMLSVGCAQNAGTNPASAEMSEALSDANQENERYTAACDTASSTTDMMSDFTDHQETMGNILSRMDAAREHMGSGSDSMMSMHCSGASFDRMCTSLTGMHDEMTSYAGRMRSAASLEEERGACTAHTDAMAAMTNGMRNDLAGMPCMHQ